MIHELEFSVTFPSTGKTFSDKHTFQKGMTAIHGKNEKGKSLRQEMIRWLFFGTKALRAPASEYKKLKGRQVFDLKGQTYTLSRTANNASLFCGDEQIAAGTTAVNQKILELFGYGLDVFDVANNCGQGQVEALGNMKPTERRAMIDQVVGLNHLDDISSEISSRALAQRKVIKALQDRLVEPEEPLLPENYSSSAILLRKIAELELLVNEAAQLRGWLTAPVQPPTLPECDVQEPLELLVAHEKRRKELDHKIAVIQAELKSIKTTDLTEEEITRREDQLLDWEQWDTKVRLEGMGEHTCPECGHHWFEEHKRLAEFEGVTEVPKPEWTQFKIEEWRGLLLNSSRREELRKQADAITPLKDRSEDVAKLKAHDAAMKRYMDQLNKHNKWVNEKSVKEARLAEIGDVTPQVVDLKQQLGVAQKYEYDLASYTKEVNRYNQDVESITQTELDEADLSSAAVALKDLRARVKKYLIPGLNRVASALISQMTDGERSSVHVQEDFDILIDGQPLTTLSGSGKAVANLAIRLALGRVLTNKTFSVFMGDEIDASMDEDRAGYTAQCLRNLTDSIDQIILVSHQKPEADHHIQL